MVRYVFSVTQGQVLSIMLTAPTVQRGKLNGTQRPGETSTHVSKELKMHNKFMNSLVVIGLIASLAACRPARPGTVAEPETAAPASAASPAAGSETSVPTASEVPASETSIATPSQLPASDEAPIAFDCDSAREIAVWDCRALVALFQ